ncbi:MAG: DUF1254 domain-containing protein [Candidatus Entotheonellia bacterium]
MVLLLAPQAQSISEQDAYDITRTFLVVGQGWSGNVPAAMEVIKSPSRYVWFIGRTQANGQKDNPPNEVDYPTTAARGHRRS